MECTVYTSYQDLVSGAEGSKYHPVAGTEAKRNVVGHEGYEGGEEHWECSVDLSRYIYDTKTCVFKDKPEIQVLELGCGGAAPSIALARERAQAELRTVLTLQEKDEKALHHTYEEICHNFTLLERPFVTVKLLVANWSEMEKVDVPASHKSHVILMSETLYRTETFDSITKILLNSLHADHGVCLSAQKRFYFGVGGGSLPYKSYLDEHPLLKMETLVQFKENNTRDISALTVSA